MCTILYQVVAPCSHITPAPSSVSNPDDPPRTMYFQCDTYIAEKTNRAAANILFIDYQLINLSSSIDDLFDYRYRKVARGHSNMFRYQNPVINNLDSLLSWRIKNTFLHFNVQSIVALKKIK